VCQHEAMAVRIELKPLGEVVEVERGAALRDVLFAYGVEFPCGGRGRCRRCRIRVLEGDLTPSEADRRLLTGEELEAGWRLACHARAQGPLTLEVGQMETAILGDDSVFSFEPRPGYGVAVDLGTTTLVAQLVSLETGRVLGVRTALNPQAVHGADIMSRVQYALAAAGARELRETIRSRVGELVNEVIAAARIAPEAVGRVVVVGNTVMHHLFCGIDIEPLAHVPFEPVRDGLECISGEELGWAGRRPTPLRVAFLPCLGGFVGSDILAGLSAVKMAASRSVVGLIDLGTNGEITFGNRERRVCASAAAGPAFEGGRISAGMRAATGAISEVSVEDGRLRPRVLGGGAPRGLCGSGLVDGIAGALELGLVRANGRLANGSIALGGHVTRTQGDIRELQLAKGAVAAGIRIVLRRLGAAAEDVERVYLAGAFGNYVNLESARRIGLISFPDEQLVQAGNTALLGAKMALFSDELEFRDLRGGTEHVSLASDPEFQEIFVDEMGF
jgi:uncharacterized 2Fe-2S/4Fe-4S cluster protein (DUF4445 family)